MVFDFEALVGHLYVVGGRSISTVPPGTLVEVAPRKAARGREADTFFTLILPSGDEAAPTVFYEQMANLAAERYFNSSGSVTAGLREIFTTLNHDLVEHNTSGKRHYEANILCAVLRGDDLYVGKVGSGMALYRHYGQVQAFPANYSSDEVLFGPPLGVQPIPDVKMASYKVVHGTRLVLADQNLADLDLETMSQSLGAADIGAVLTDFKDLVTTRVTLMAVEFVPPEAPSPVPARVAESTAKPSTSTSTQRTVTTTTTGTAEVVAVAQPNMGDRLGEAAEDVTDQARRGVGSMALALASGLDRVNRVLDRITPQPAEGQRRWLAATRLAGIVVLLPVVVVVLVIAMSVLNVGQTEFELCLDEAMKTADLARSINPNDINGVLAAWNAVLIQADRCDTLRPESDPTVASLIREGQEIIDRLSNVARRDGAVLETFPNASLTQVLLQGLDLYVLDDQNEYVYRVTLANDGRSVIPNTRQALPAMRLGASVGEFTVDDIIDITWSEESNSVIALDRNGVLIACSPQFLTRCDSERLLGSENWVNPVAMTLWQERLYVLDPDANQIWRYEPSGGTYANAPTEYFSGDNRPDIRAAVDFAIDSDGAVFLLYAQGIIDKFISGEQQTFTFAGFPEGQALTSADAFYLDDNPLALRMYIVSRASRTIFEVSKAGTFFNSYRTYEEDQFTSLGNVIVDASQQVLYALSGNAIITLERNE